MSLRINLYKLLAIFITLGVVAAQNPVQKSSSNQFKLTSIEVTGNKHYSIDQITSVTGLRIGQSVSDDGKTVDEDIFRQAANRVGNTGAFSDVTYRYEYSARGTKFQLQVREADKFLAARFDNFVWFSDEELLNALKERVALFDGSLPVSGSITDQVAKVLQAMLDDRRVSGTVEYIPTTRMGGGPIEAITYKVSGLPIHIKNMDFPGAQSGELPLLQAAAKPLADQDYSRSMLRAQEQYNFLPVYLSRGYLKAEFADSQAKVLQQSNPGLVLVDAIFPVTPNRQYKLAEIQWEGNTVFASDKLQPLIQLHSGEPANAVQLDKDVQAVKKLYGTRGYIAATVAVSPRFDDATSLVHYVLELREGDLYRMGTLEVQGLDPDTTRALSRVWTLQGGDPYDTSYIEKQFFPALAKARISVPQSLEMNVETSLNGANKTVNVKVIFAPKKQR